MRTRNAMRPPARVVRNMEGGNCGTGAGGFKPGNVAAIAPTVNALPDRAPDVADLAARLHEVLSPPVSQRRARLLAAEILDGMDNEASAEDIALRLLGVARDMTPARALAIATTEVARIDREGQLDVLEERSGEDAKVRWRASAGACPRCRARNGEVMTVAEARGVLPLHVHCVVGDSIVRADDVTAFFKAHYTGEVVELTTAKGRRLAVTVNHVLLTECGFLPAYLIDEGTHVIDAATIYGASVPTPDDYYGESGIADVWATAVEQPDVTIGKVPTASEYLHGDGSACNREIEVVRADGTLGDQRQERRGDVVERLFMSSQFIGGGPFLRPQSFGAQLLKCVASAADRRVSCCRDALALANRRLLPPSHLCVLSAAGFAAELPQYDVDGAPRISESLGDGERALTLVKEVNDLLRRYGRQVVLDRVTAVEKRHVKNLPVYDLETQSSLYVVNGIVSSNCHCRWTRVYATRNEQTANVGDNCGTGAGGFKPGNTCGGGAKNPRKPQASTGLITWGEGVIDASKLRLKLVMINKLKVQEDIDTPSKVESIQRAFEGMEKVPPISVDRFGNVKDGHHRLEAAKRAGLTHIWAMVQPRVGTSTTNSAAAFFARCQRDAAGRCLPGTGGLTSRVAANVRRKAAAKYAKLEARYGRAGAVAVMAGIAATLPAPIPGSSFAVLGIAEGIRAVAKTVQRYRRKAAVPVPATANVTANADPELHAMVAEGHDFVRDLHAEHGAELDPRFNRPALHAAIAGLLYGELMDEFDFGEDGYAYNMFCPTGPGGGIDPTCGKGSGRKKVADMSPHERVLAAAERAGKRKEAMRTERRQLEADMETAFQDLHNLNKRIHPETYGPNPTMTKERYDELLKPHQDKVNALTDKHIALVEQMSAADRKVNELAWQAVALPADQRLPRKALDGRLMPSAKGNLLIERDAERAEGFLAKVGGRDINLSAAYADGPRRGFLVGYFELDPGAHRAFHKPEAANALLKTEGTSGLYLSSLRSDAATAVHEWGHALEHQHPEIGRRALEFLDHRVKDEPTVALKDVLPTHQYEAHERGRKNAFEAAFGEQAHYVGKDYGRRATEIMSMGLEKLYSDPVAFAKADPEYFNFVVDTVQGRDWKLRSKQ